MMARTTAKSTLDDDWAGALDTTGEDKTRTEIVFVHERVKYRRPQKKRAEQREREREREMERVLAGAPHTHTHTHTRVI